MFVWPDKYPTRTVEHMLAWMTLAWGVSVLLPGNILTAGTFHVLLAIMPESAWGAIGVAIGVARLVALYLNGSWRRSPELRFAGAAFGLTWWLILSVLYYAAVQQGAADFPMRYALVVMIVFEGYSCYRCGQDAARAKVVAASS